jgi:hypothetical protein
MEEMDSELLGHSDLINGRRGERSAKGFSRTCVIVVLIISLVFLILMVVSTGLFGYYVAPRASTDHSLIIAEPSSLVPLVSDGFNTLFVQDVSVNASKDPNDVYPLNLSLYKGVCESVNVTSYNLPVIKRSGSPQYSSLRLPFNYHDGDVALFAIKGSYLTYTTDVNSSSNANNADPSRCPLQLYLFDDEDKYKQFNNNDIDDGYIQDSGCLSDPNAPQPTVNMTTFHLNEDYSSYYVTASIERGTVVVANITGTINKYSMNGLQMEKCYINSYQNAVCTVNIAQVGVSTQNTQMCIYCYSQYNNHLRVSYVTSSTGIHNVASVITLSAGVMFLLMCVLSLLICVICVLTKLRATNETIPFTINSGSGLIHYNSM